MPGGRIRYWQTALTWSPQKHWMTEAMITLRSRHSLHPRHTGLRSAGAFAAMSVALVAVVACSAAGAPVASIPPSQSPAPTEAPVESPSADPSVAPSAPAKPSTPVEPNPSADPSEPAEEPAEEPDDSPFVPEGLGPDRIGRVVASDGLRVRTLPTVGDESQRLDPTLDKGTTFYVVDGPVIADGYAWYQVDPYGESAGDRPFGWVAAGSREGDAWIENHLDGCDSMGTSVETVGAMWPQGQLYCYGSDEIELTGQLVCEFGDIEGMPNGPAWVEFDRYCELRAPDFNIHDGISLRVWGKAATSLLDEGSPVDGQYTVVGHFDDPGASECEGGGFDGDRSPAEAVLVCRMAFVATEVRPA
jgi:hypothetical protein